MEGFSDVGIQTNACKTRYVHYLQTILMALISTTFDSAIRSRSAINLKTFSRRLNWLQRVCKFLSGFTHSVVAASSWPSSQLTIVSLDLSGLTVL